MSQINLPQEFEHSVLATTHASAITKLEVIQPLWSGAGEISRYQLENAKMQTVVIKHAKLPDQQSQQLQGQKIQDEQKIQGAEKTQSEQQKNQPHIQHPRGWNTQLSVLRKKQSYQVESHWYQTYSQRCNEQCPVPICHHVSSQNNEFLMVLEDLDAHGFPVRKTTANLNEMKACLNWLAWFHGEFLFDLNNGPTQLPFKGLWQTGCYWHLDTRPDELAALQDKTLKAAATKIDQKLKNTRYQTLLHGDAKLANFCFSNDGQRVAAVDFQYVGQGCAMKDVAYFIGSCLDAEGCYKNAEPLLDYYFKCLTQAIIKQKPHINPEQVEAQWRSLYATAWADFHRFLKGWSPNHWKLHGYSEQLTQQALMELGFNKKI